MGFYVCLFSPMMFIMINPEVAKLGVFWFWIFSLKIQDDSEKMH